MFKRTGKQDPVIGTVWRWGRSDSLFCIVGGMDKDGDYLAQFFTGGNDPHRTYVHHKILFKNHTFLAGDRRGYVQQ